MIEVVVKTTYLPCDTTRHKSENITYWMSMCSCMCSWHGKELTLLVRVEAVSVFALLWI